MVFLLALFLVGCEPHVDWPAEFPASSYRRGQLTDGPGTDAYAPPPAVAEKIRALLNEQFGSPEYPKPKGASEADTARIVEGSRHYLKNCIYCHGIAGAGDGPTGKGLDPRPRDYRRGAFKWKSTLLPNKPTRADLRRTLEHGVPGTSMPPFGLLPDAELERLIDYVIFLSQRGEWELRLLRHALNEAPDKEEDLKEYLAELKYAAEDSLKKIKSAWSSPKPVPITGTRPTDIDDPVKFETSVQNGKKLFLSDFAGCVKCHGPDGKGERRPGAGLKADDFIDVWGNPIQPRNLTAGVFRGGRTPADVFRRVHQGIYPSKMPANEKSLKPEQLWDLVNFVRALPYRPDLLAQGK